jgi:hypothetical protein
MIIRERVCFHYIHSIITPAHALSSFLNVPNQGLHSRLSPRATHDHHKITAPTFADSNDTSMTQTAASPNPSPLGDASPVPGDGVNPPPCWLLFPPSPVYPLISSVTVLVILFVLVDVPGVSVLLQVVTFVELPPPPPVAVVRSVVDA